MSFFTDIWDEVKADIGSVVETTRDFLEDDIINPVENFVSGAATEIRDDVKGVTTTVYADAKSFVGSAESDIKSLGTVVNKDLNSVGGFVGDKVGGILNTIEWLPYLGAGLIVYVIYTAGQHPTETVELSRLAASKF